LKNNILRFSKPSVLENKEHYKYFSTLKSIEVQTGPFGDGTPGNPNNTVGGNAIGFFCVATISTINIEIP